MIIEEKKYNEENSVVVVDDITLQYSVFNELRKANSRIYYTEDKDFFLSKTYEDGTKELLPISESIKETLRRLDLDTYDKLLEIKKKEINNEI